MPTKNILYGAIIALSLAVVTLTAIILFSGNNPEAVARESVNKTAATTTHNKSTTDDMVVDKRITRSNERIVVELMCQGELNEDKVRAFSKEYFKEWFNDDGTVARLFKGKGFMKVVLIFYDDMHIYNRETLKDREYNTTFSTWRNTIDKPGTFYFYERKPMKWK